jgi:hypothetical protein
MRAIPFALSISHFVSKIGADAGFAALIGLAFLILLYFAQARETATLRDRATQSEEQVQQLEWRLGQLMRGGAQAGAQQSGPATGTSRVPVIPAPAGIPARAAAAAAPANSRAVAGRQAVFAPAGVGAPALASATRMTPASQQGPISIRATPSPAQAPVATPVGAPAGAGEAAPVAAAAAAAGAALGEHASSGSGGAVAAPSGPRPATAAGANGGRVPPPAAAPAPTPAPPPPAMRPEGPRQNPQARLANSRSAPAAARRQGQGGPRGRSRVRGAVLAVIGLLVVAAIVVALLVLTSNGSNSSSRSSSVANSSASGSRTGSAALKPGDITVAVLNGTTTNGLAKATSLRLASAGYRRGRTATATDQTEAATVVGYRGRGNRRAAVMVARSLKLGTASVQEVDQANEAVACPQASSCTAQVVVTVGADLASAVSSPGSAGASTTAASTT